jgi:hypothetical protein
MNLTEHKVYFAIVPLNFAVPYEKFFNYVTPFAEMFYTALLTDAEGKFIGVNQTIFKFKYLPCKERKDLFPHIDKLGVIAETLFQSGVCFFPEDEANYYVNGTYFSGVTSVLDILTFPCSKADQSECATP